MSRFIQIVEVGPRDGLQNEKAVLDPDVRVDFVRRLEAAGIRAINNIVDITNYVMLECGQPLHAFDQKLLAEGRIVVRHPKPGEKILTLDGVERALEPQMLVIADAQKPLAIAGVMGGEHSGINESTTDVLLESANFRPASVRATSKKLGML